ncbi:nuclear pore complex protein [Actinidia rufa]|uniref:Nuclear pore complex protein n=1 Tax=Actinidia rufa TaxID=165716 RepID=A0A7J0G5B4_9ERIC|nr:nuclear pore complex protein [Actinidia rufa]
MGTTEAGEGTSYEGGGGGGGKFRKRPFRKPQATPYDRPPTALRNRRTDGWLSKIVDPASKLISATAHLFFSSLSRKRLPPAPPRPPPEANQESRERFHEAVPDHPPEVQGPAINDGGKVTNSSSSSGLSELEQILKQKTFTRVEIDRLTELLQSRSDDLPNGVEGNRTKSNLLQPVSAIVRRDEFASSPVQENRIEKQLESHRFHESISTPLVSSQVLEEDVAAPAELAKAYMGNKPSKVSPSMLGLRGQTLRGDASLPNNVLFPPESAVMSLVQKPALRAGVPENGFITPRSRGRSAIYSMARTPYSRVHLTATQKATSVMYDGGYGPSPSSSSRFGWEHGGQYSSNSKQLALKRRSSVLEDNIGSVGPIRRLRQKTNLATPKNLSLPVSGSPFSSRGTGIWPDAYPISSAQKLPSFDESKHKISKTGGENENNGMPGTSYTPVPSKSTEMATKILQQLEKLVPKEKSSDGKVAAARDKSQNKLTPNMVGGQALRILEGVESSKVLHNPEDSHKLKDTRNMSLPNAQDTSSQKKAEENGQKRVIIARDVLATAGIGNAIVSGKEAVPDVNTAVAVSTQFPTQTSQKKWGFQMSAHEDFLELDEEIHSNKAASTLLAERKEKLEVSVVEDRVVSSEAVTVDKTPSVSDVRTLAGPHKFSASYMASPQSTSAFDKTVAPKEPNAPPLFSFSSKNVDEIPPLKFSSSSSVSEVLKSSAPLEPKPQSPNSLVNVASGGTDVLPKIPESDKGDMKDMQKYGDTVGRSEISISSAIATSTSTSKIFSFGAPANSPNLSNGSLDSSPSIFSSPSPVLASINFTNQTFTNSFTNVAPSTTATITTDGGTAIVHTSSSSLSTSATAPSFPAASIFKFGSTSVAPTNSVSTVSTTSNAETTDLKAKIAKDITFGNLTSSPYGGASFAMASTGSNMFGFSASAASSSANNLSQGSIFGSSGESLVSKQASSAGTGVGAVMQSMPIQFGSSAPSPTFGTSETTSFTSSPSIFGSSTSRSSLFGSSTPTVFGPSTDFGQSTSASLSETNSISSGGVTWQAPKPSIFGSNTASPSTMFPFGASAITAAATNSAPMVFGSSTGASSGLGNGDQMNMEDNMSEDPVQASTPTFPVFGRTGISVTSSTPTVPVFGQSPNPISNPSSGSVFAPSAGQPFQFGGQQNQSTSQNPSAFQASNSLGFSAGGSFSLGSAGNDKGNRRIVRVKHKSRRN